MRPALYLVLTLLLAPYVAAQESRVITCLGRIEPDGGVVRLAGPSGLGSVIVDLKVAEGDWVEKGQVIAITDDYAVRSAERARLQAELEDARGKLKREQKLGKSLASSASALESLTLSVKAAEASLAAADAMVEQAVVRAPIKGQIIDVHARPGERVGVEGVVEVARTDRMYAVAEVYETDIINVKPGQKARVISPALPATATGTVERIGLKVGRMDVLGMDPVADTDARVVEVHILLDEPELVSALTNLQVQAEIIP